MNIAVEISMYPLAEEYLPAIQSFIDRLRTNDRLQVLTNTMSTQVFGELDEVFAALQREIKASFEAGPRAVFVAKFLAPAAG
ncbi:MAG: YkoF family thiamine/hydroxymethylpyrimidine-binding protein [Steroidobacteraceae bacterium]